MTSAWPDSLVRAIVRQDFVLFVGSGVSASCKNNDDSRPPTWKSLIEGAAELIPNKTAQNRIKKRARTDLLDAAEMLLFEASRSAVKTDVLEYVVTAVEGLHADPFQPSEWHDELLKLYPSTVLTTNYDRILERATQSGFSVLRPEDKNLGRDIRNGTPVILKVHGTVDDRNSMVMSHSQYSLLRTENRAMMEVLRALFLTRTCLFVGYSLADPDIRLLLENLVLRGHAENAHYLLGPRPEHAHLRELYRATYGVALIEYPPGDHAKGLALLRDLALRVEARRISAS